MSYVINLIVPINTDMRYEYMNVCDVCDEKSSVYASLCELSDVQYKDDITLLHNALKPNVNTIVCT